MEPPASTQTKENAIIAGAFVGTLVILLGDFFVDEVLSLVHKKKSELEARSEAGSAAPGRREEKVVMVMKAPLSRNEIEILNRHVATIAHQLSEIGGLLESRLGETNEFTVSARNAQREFARFADRIRRQAAITREEPQPSNESQTA